MKRTLTAAVLIAAALTLTGCAAVAETAGVSTKTVTLKDGGTIECVVVSAGSGTATVDCIEATYIDVEGDSK